MPICYGHSCCFFCLKSGEAVKDFGKVNCIYPCGHRFGMKITNIQTYFLHDDFLPHLMIRVFQRSGAKHFCLIRVQHVYSSINQELASFLFCNAGKQRDLFPLPSAKPRWRAIPAIVDSMPPFPAARSTVPAWWAYCTEP